MHKAEGLHPGADPKDRDSDVFEPRKFLHLHGKVVVF